MGYPSESFTATVNGHQRQLHWEIKGGQRLVLWTEQEDWKILELQRDEVLKVAHQLMSAAILMLSRHSLQVTLDGQQALELDKLLAVSPRPATIEAIRLLINRMSGATKLKVELV